jgi:hypothetical protein
MTGINDSATAVKITYGILVSSIAKYTNVNIATKTQPMMYIRRRPILSDRAPAIGAQIKPSTVVTMRPISSKSREAPSTCVP